MTKPGERVKETKRPPAPTNKSSWNNKPRHVRAAGGREQPGQIGHLHSSRLLLCFPAEAPGEICRSQGFSLYPCFVAVFCGAGGGSVSPRLFLLRKGSAGGEWEGEVMWDEAAWSLLVHPGAGPLWPLSPRERLSLFQIRSC